MVDKASRLIFSLMCDSMKSQTRCFIEGERPPRLASGPSGMGMKLSMLNLGCE